MPGDEKVAFYLRYRQHIEEWAALREQAGRELEEALVRAVGIMRERPTTPMIIEGDSRQRPWYGIALELPGAATARVLVALGWTQSQLLKPSGESWPYIGIMSPSAARGGPVYDRARISCGMRHVSANGRAPKAAGSGGATFRLKPTRRTWTPTPRDRWKS